MYDPSEISYTDIALPFYSSEYIMFGHRSIWNVDTKKLLKYGVEFCHTLKHIFWGILKS